MDQECQVLRLELKDWEKAFATSNGGKKAGRDDIKRHPEIAAKYKLYNKLRAQGAGSLEKDTANVPDQPLRKKHVRKPQPTIACTPQKRSKHLYAPLDESALIGDAPGSAQKTPVAHRKSIGPTPQRNGHVLGLFDLLTPSSSLSTPSKRQSLIPIPPNLVDTPVRVKTMLDNDKPNKSVYSPTKRKRSPSSASKTTSLAAFLTPSARRIADVSGTPKASKPVSVLRFDETPAFLRRDSQKFSQSQQAQATYIRTGGDVFSWSPVAVRVMPPKPAGKGLSALVKGLRDMEEAKLDDELDMLREMEGGQEGNLQDSQAKDVADICVEDSQIPDMPLGPDGEGESDDEDIEALKTEGKDRSGRPLKIWKKKGQKRTTRRVTIKPNTAKWKPEQEWKGGEADESEDEVVAVKETQVGKSTPAMRVGEDEDLETDNDCVSGATSDTGTQQGPTNGEQGKHTNRPKIVPQEPVKEKKKKVVKAAAHMNYRALKIRNKNSKGKGSGRFGRRR
ncbi:MAG: hypothetical protein Q9209_000450 [Squamulea sp. 1 TL-2023]